MVIAVPLYLDTPLESNDLRVLFETAKIKIKKQCIWVEYDYKTSLLDSNSVVKTAVRAKPFSCRWEVLWSGGKSNPPRLYRISNMRVESWWTRIYWKTPDGDRVAHASSIYGENYSWWLSFCENALRDMGMKAGAWCEELNPTAAEVLKSLSLIRSYNPDGTWGGAMHALCCSNRYNSEEWCRNMINKMWHPHMDVSFVSCRRSDPAYYGISKKMLGVYDWIDIMDPNFNFEQFEPGLTWDEFIYRNPAVARQTTNNKWLLLRYALCEKSENQEENQETAETT